MRVRIVGIIGGAGLVGPHVHIAAAVDIEARRATS
jgi:hypothetical protein